MLTKTTTIISNTESNTQNEIVDNLFFKTNPNRTLQWLGSVNYSNLHNTLEEIKKLSADSPSEDIHLLVCSPGGASGIAMSFYDSMRYVLKPHLHTIGSGDVDSSGIIIFLSGDKRYITKNTTLFFHMAGRTLDTEKRYTVSDFGAMLKEDKLKDFHYASIVAERSNGKLTTQKVLKMMANNTLLTPPEMVKFGLAHGVLE